MKRILISAVLALALAGTTAFAAQNKNAGGKAKPAAAKPAATKNMGATKTKGKAKPHRRHHRKAVSKAKTTGNKNK